MARFGFLGSSYTSRSTAVADEELINAYLERDESGQAQAKASFYATPGTKLFLDIGSSIPQARINGQYQLNGRAFAVSGGHLWEYFSDKTKVDRGPVATDAYPASISASALELFIVSGVQAYVFNLGTNVLTNVTSLMLGSPIQGCFCDGYFLVIFQNSQKIQFSALFNGASWPGANVVQVSVFEDNLVSISQDHREVTVKGSKHGVVYYNSGSSNVFDVISGSKFEHGSAATYSEVSIDNTSFWVERDQDGNCIARRMGGNYVPQRISTYAVEWQWQSYSTVSDAISYCYQEGGHTFWVIYFPTANVTWVFDIGEGLWHRRGYWKNGVYEAHHSQNHIFAFGKHLVGDWGSDKLYEMSMDIYDDAGNPKRWLRRTATVSRELENIIHDRLTVDADPGVMGDIILAGPPTGPAYYVLADNVGGQWYLTVGADGSMNLNATSAQTVSTVLDQRPRRHYDLALGSADRRRITAVDADCSGLQRIDWHGSADCNVRRPAAVRLDGQQRRNPACGPVRCAARRSNHGALDE
jgi:hypothetical protein